MKLFRKIKGKLGFTLAEMLIVVAILAILTAVAAPNVAKYSRSINLRELNDSARAIYMAAEHKFMNEIEMGNELPGLDDGAAKITALLPRYDETSEVDIFYLKSNDSGSPLKKLMSSGGTDVESTGVVESQLFDNNFIVEYNPKTGDVYGVFYSEKENFDDYTTNFYSDVADVQSKKLIGYYGLMNEKPDAHPVVQEIEKPTVEVINKEKLVVKINTESTENQYVTISVNGKEIIKRNNTYMNGSVEIILDSLTPGTPGIPGKANLPSENGQLQPKYEDTIANWLDETGLTIDGSDMTLTVTFYDKDGIARDQSVTKTFNPLFANGSTSDTAYIEYGRHLQNLDKCSTIQTAVIKKTINFASTAGNYEGWANAEIYQGRKFSALNIYSSIHLSANAGVEIQNMDAKGGGLMYFGCLGTTIEQLTFRNCTIAGDEYAGQAGTVGAFFTGNIKLSNVTVINPTIIGSTSGGLIGSAEEITIDNCKVYVEAGSEETWEDPANDPYYSSDVSGTGMAGGLVGRAQAVIITNSYSAVKVESTSGASGGLIGDAEKDTVIEKSFAAGHTYKGTFEGKLDDGTEFSLKDNVKGATAGGIVGSCNDGTLKLSGTVFSTCSVSGTTVDPAYNGTAVTDGATVYTLGTAYKDNGGGTFEEIKKSADANVKTGDEVKDDASTAVGKRYDLKVSSVYKYPVPNDMTMHGDWPSSDAVTGFFYWEKHGKDYNFHIICDEKEYKNLCTLQDGVDISESGYGLFTIGGDLSGALYYGRSGKNYDSDEKAKSLSAIMGDSYTDTKLTDALIIALGEMDDGLKTLKPEDLVTEICTTAKDEDKANGNIKVTVNGKSFTFTPCFYGIAESENASCGGSSSPFAIRTAQQLKNISFFLDKKNFSYQQQHDILPGTIDPIGSNENPFIGTYDGGSYRIIDAKFNTTEGSDYAGLFGVTDGAKLENIVMFVEAAAAENFVEIKGKNVGVIVGNAENAGKITNCVAAGYTVIGSENSGGIAGISACPITNCEANIKFGKVQNVAGGIVGNGENSEITNCYALVHGIESPKSSMTLGGIAGKAKTVKDCYVIFAGQTEGYPIATNLSKESVASNYYINQAGYYQSRKEFKEIGTGITLDDLKNKSIDKFDSANTTYYSNSTIADADNYPYPAVFEDNGEIEHYGPIPEAGRLYMTYGPLVGVYNFYEISYGGNPSKQLNGMMTYNRNGILFGAENPKDEAGVASKRYIGIFVEPHTLEDPNLKITVDGKQITKFKNQFFNDDGTSNGYSARISGATYFTSKKDHQTDNGSYYGEQINQSLLERFEFYLLLDDDGNEIDLESSDGVDHVIEFWYNDGMLLTSRRSLLSKKRNTEYYAEIPPSPFDESDIPEVGMFRAKHKTVENGVVSDGYYVYTYIKGEQGGSGDSWATDEARIGILIEESRVSDMDNRRIEVLINNAIVQFERWDDIMTGSHNEILNKETYNIDGYVMYVATNVRAIENIINNAFSMDFFYGSNKFINYSFDGSNYSYEECTPQIDLDKMGIVAIYDDNTVFGFDGNGDRIGAPNKDAKPQYYALAISDYLLPYKDQITVHLEKDICTIDNTEHNSFNNYPEMKADGWHVFILRQYSNPITINMYDNNLNNIIVRYKGKRFEMAQISGKGYD